VIVSVSKGLPAGKAWPVPTEAAIMDQQGCRYVPHVLAVRVGQPVRFLNSDALFHNVHTLPKANRDANVPMPASRKEVAETFTKEEGPFGVKCDVHPWMQGWVRVFSHPFYAVTRDDGAFRIPDLPAGSYELTAWHETLGTKTVNVTVGKDAKPVQIHFAVAAGK
jgi:plastocyanin